MRIILWFLRFRDNLARGYRDIFGLSIISEFLGYIVVF